MTVSERTGSVVMDTAQSPYTQLHPVPVSAVQLEDPVWESRREVLRNSGLQAQHEQLEQTGRIDNFRRVTGEASGSFEGLYFNDTDIYKWLEAAAWTLASNPNPDLDRAVDELIAHVGAAQQDDGYVDTYHQLGMGTGRWTELHRTHELYCAGHLFQAAVAHHRATGKTSLLEIARKFADHICDVFGPAEEGRLPGTDGHPEVEMGLVELARETGDQRYLRQAQYFLDVRGQGLAGGDEYRQDHQPFRSLQTMVGHAVRATYLAAGAADIYAETGDPTLMETLERLWDDVTSRRIYITGGIGSRHDGEAFGKDYELPNLRAYAETCAGIANVMWNWRMLHLTRSAKYTDLMETALFNAVLPGQSVDGQHFFYDNPLADDGTHRRQAWFYCACCPPNVARLLASISGYFYSTSSEGVWVHLYAEGAATVTRQDGQTVQLKQTTRYPWDGEVTIEVGGGGTFTLFLRVPAWCENGATIEINGEPHTGEIRAGSYVDINRQWSSGDIVSLRLPMPVRVVESHPYVFENAGRVAIMRGPILYCVEEADNLDIDPRSVILPSDITFETVHEEELLGGVTVLRADVGLLLPETDWDQQLYRTKPVDSAKDIDQSTELTLIPYYAWANRTPGRMEVWLRHLDQL